MTVTHAHAPAPIQQLGNAPTALHQCLQCEHAFDTAAGLRTHIARIHGMRLIHQLAITNQCRSVSSSKQARVHLRHIQNNGTCPPTRPSSFSVQAIDNIACPFCHI
eukprot:7099358-Heterocapsa_arctica.AAC.1